MRNILADWLSYPKPKPEENKRLKSALKMISMSNFHQHILNMNDTFGYGCADSESMEGGDLDELFPLYEKYGSCVFVAYASVKRDGELPIKECQSKDFFSAKKEIEILAKDGTVLWEQYWEREGRAKAAEADELRKKGDKI